MKIADLSLNLNECALMVARCLENMETCFLPFNQKRLGGYFGADFKTKPLYNGRERGLVFSMKVYGSGGSVKQLNIWVYEHRVCDDICLTIWEGSDYTGFEDIPNGDEKYENGTWIEKSFDYGDYYNCAKYIYNKFGAYFADKTYASIKRDYMWDVDYTCCKIDGKEEEADLPSGFSPSSV